MHAQFQYTLRQLIDGSAVDHYRCRTCFAEVRLPHGEPHHEDFVRRCLEGSVHRLDMADAAERGCAKGPGVECAHAWREFDITHDAWKCVACGANDLPAPIPPFQQPATRLGTRFVAGSNEIGKILGMISWHGHLIVCAEAGVFLAVNHPRGPYLEAINTAPPPVNG